MDLTGSRSPGASDGIAWPALIEHQIVERDNILPVSL
jgi:hypothetical protein